jgi:hypothetical protein
LKNKVIILALGLSLALTGCGSSGNQKSGGNTTNNHPSSVQTPNPNAGTTNTNSGTNQSSTTTVNISVGSNQSAETSTNSSSPSSNSSTDPANNAAPHVNMSMVTAVRLADFNTGWAGGNGWVAKTINGGKSWAVVYQGSGNVQQIFALNHSNVWVTLNQGGSYSKLLHSIDGGQHWFLVGTTPNNAFLHFTSTTTAVSGNYLSQDGGKTWYRLPIPNNTVGDAYFHDEKNGWVVTQGNHVFYVKRTTDGGKSWETVLSKSLASSLDGAIIRSAGTNDAWIELIGDTGMTQTSYSVFHTADRGKSWETVIANSTAGGGPAPGFSQDNNAHVNKGTKPGPLYVVNSQVAFMGGSCPACDNQNSIGWTKDAGKTWVNSNVTLKGYGDAFLAFADANNGWWITTETQNPSRMYATTDGGFHWKQVYIFH